MSSTAPALDYVADPENQGYDYRPVPPLVPIGAAFVLLSVLAFGWDVLVAVPALGAVLCGLAWSKIRRSPTEYSGGFVAASALVLNMTLAIGAIGFHAYSFATEVPQGLKRVSFATDISAKGLVIKNGQPELHPEVEELVNQPVFLKGYMYPTRQVQGLKSFVLCKDSGDCCFGGQPKVTDMIVVQMTEGKAVNHRDGLVAVGGTFLAKPTTDPSGLTPVYRIDADYFGAAKTSY